MILRKCFGGRTWPLRLEVARLGVGAVAVFEGRGWRVQSRRERDGGDSFLATTDSIRQQYRTAFCALKQKRSSYNPAIYMVSRLSFDAPSKVFWGEDFALALEGVGPGEQGRTSSFRIFWLLETSFHAFTFRGLDFVFFHHVSGSDARATLLDGE